ncbi:MAG TPA: hypothetical protein V6C85_16505 [Allocoleopsis sp.]
MVNQAKHGGKRPFAQMAVERYQLKLIVYEPVTEEIVQWRS